MRQLLLVLLIGLAASNTLILPFGYFTEGQNLYLLSGITPEQRSYAETQLGCHIECSQSCINSFEGKHLAKCINLCGCEDLLSVTVLQNNLNLAEYNEFELTSLEGEVTNYKVKQGSGSEVYYEDLQNGNKRFYYNVESTPGTDFEATVVESNQGRKQVKLVTWRTNNRLDDGQAEYSKVNTKNGVKETTSVHLPNRNYQARDTRTTTYEQLGNSSRVTVKDAFQSNHRTVKFDADLTSSPAYNGGDDYSINININDKPKKSYRKNTYTEGGWYQTDSGYLVTLQEVTLDEVQYVQAELGCDLHCNSRCLNNFSDKQVATCIELCGCLDLVQVQDVIQSQNVMRNAINTNVFVDYTPDNRKFNPAGSLSVNDPDTPELDFYLRHDSVETPNGLHNVVAWNSTDSSTNGSIVHDIVSEQPVDSPYSREPFKLAEKFDVTVGNHTFSDENSTEIRENEGVLGVKYEESAKLDGVPVYDFEHTQVSENYYRRGNTAFSGHFDINTVQIPTADNYIEKCQEICEGDQSCLRVCHKGFGPSEQVEEVSLIGWMFNGLLIAGGLLGLAFVVKAYVGPKRKAKKYYDEELMASYHSLQVVQGQ